MKKNAPFQKEGIMSISKALTTNVDSKVNKIVEGAKRQGIDFDQYNEEQVKYILELNKKKLEPRVISADSPEGRGITEALLGRKEGKVIKADFGKPFAEEMVTTERVITDIKKLEPIEAMKEANKVLKGEGRYKNLSQADREKIVNDESVTDHIFERNVPIDPEDMATGGRAGFKNGMNRRTFLKLLGGLATIPIVGKIFKPIKLATGVKKVPIIKTDNVPGKPEWFDQLVNKVIIEGDDVTKKFATGERQSIHQKTLDDGSVVRVTEDVDDGAVRVEYESDANVFEDPVQLQYKKPLPDESDPRPTPEFTTSESGPVGRQYGPDDFEIEVDEVGGSSIEDLSSDVSKLKEYATGKKPTMKELVQNIERRKKAQRITYDPEAQSDAVIARQGEGLASGGIARMLGE